MNFAPRAILLVYAHDQQLLSFAAVIDAWSVQTTAWRKIMDGRAEQSCSYSIEEVKADSLIW